MKTTRYHDLGHLEEGRDNRGYESKHAKKLINKVHKKSKDRDLEKMRHALFDARSRKNWALVEKLERIITQYERQRYF